MLCEINICYLGTTFIVLSLAWNKFEGGRVKRLMIGLQERTPEPDKIGGNYGKMVAKIYCKTITSTLGKGNIIMRKL